jgi:hypothetical protein
MALASGSSKIVAEDLTLHTKTAIRVAELLLPGRVTFTVTQLLPQLTPGWSTHAEDVAGAGGQQQEKKKLHLISCKGSGIIHPFSSSSRSI